MTPLQFEYLSLCSRHLQLMGTRDSEFEDEIRRMELERRENEEKDDDDDGNESDKNEEKRNDDDEEDKNESANKEDEEKEGREDRSDNENEENIGNEDEEEWRWRELEDMRRRIEFLEEAQARREQEDRVGGARYRAILQFMAESDGGRRGAPPAAKSAVLALPTVEILTEQETIVCPICKDVVNMGETATKLPCGHGYHGDCLVQWLGLSNTCPVCRFELPTDD